MWALDKTGLELFQWKCDQKKLCIDLSVELFAVLCAERAAKLPEEHWRWLQEEFSPQNWVSRTDWKQLLSFFEINKYLISNSHIYSVGFLLSGLYPNCSPTRKPRLKISRRWVIFAAEKPLSACFCALGSRVLCSPQVVEDIENLKFEKGPWPEQDDISYHYMRILWVSEDSITSQLSCQSPQRLASWKCLFLFYFFTAWRINRGWRTWPTYQNFCQRSPSGPTTMTRNTTPIDQYVSMSSSLYEQTDDYTEECVFSGHPK